MKDIAWKAIAVFGAFMLASTGLAQEPAALPARTLGGKPFSVVADLPARPSLLVVGFTRASRSQTEAWSRRVAGDPVLKAALSTFQVVVLDDVPALFRGFIIGGIKNGVPESMRPHFLIVTSDGEAWKRLVGYSKPDAAYLVLFDTAHEVVWRADGPFAEAAFHALRAAEEKLRNGSAAD